METIALRNGLDFLRVEPRITRNEKEGTLDVAFVLTKGARVFVERIDIEGNATTLDEVVRRQFRTVEGDPLNAREIRDAAERIRALGFFTTAEVNANPGTGPDQVIVDVNVDEKPTGSLNFGASYSVANGVGFNVGLSEANFLGRGQYVSVNLNVGTDNQNSSITFIEPALLDRDLKFRFNAYYNTSNNDNARFDTESAGIQPSIEFPLNDLTRLALQDQQRQAERRGRRHAGRFLRSFWAGDKSRARLATRSAMTRASPGSTRRAACCCASTRTSRALAETSNG